MPSATQPDILIAAAHPIELAGLRETLGRTLSAHVRGLHVAACAVGVGIPLAAVGTARSLHDRRPRGLILLGSCGVYPAIAAQAARAPRRSSVSNEPAPLLLPLIPDEVKLVDAAESSGQAAFPGPMPSRARVHRGLAAGLRRAAQDPLRGALATTLGITTSNALARRIERASGCHAENLEALAVALACQSERVAFAALLLITNVVGSRGRAQWVEQHTAAADRGAAIVLDWIARGAPGLPPRK